MEEMKMPELNEGEKIEEVIFDNAEIKTVRVSMRAYRDQDGVTHSQEEGEWISVIKGEVTFEVADKTVCIKTAQKTFIPSGAPYRVNASSDPCVLLVVYHK